MPISTRPNPTPEPTPTPIEVDKENDTSVVDLDETSLAELITHVGGSDWAVTYFQQYLRSGETAHSQDGMLDTPLQQYRKINDFLLKVQSPLEYSSDTTNHAQMLVGSSIIMPRTVVPNRGDMFLADIGQGVAGLFTIDTVRLLSHYKDRAYEVEYRLYRQIHSSGDTYLTDLENKVVETYHFRKDLLLGEFSPIIQEDEIALQRTIADKRDMLLEHYLNLYYSEEFGTVMLPDSERRVYDPLVPEFIKSLFDVHDHPTLRRLAEINAGAVPAFANRNIWDSLLEGRPELFVACPKKAEVRPVALFRNDPTLYNIAYSGLDYLVCPVPLYDVDRPFEKDVSTQQTYLQSIPARVRDLDQSSAGELGDIPDTPYLKGLDTYVFTQSFYDLGEVNTRLESELYAYLNQTGLDKETLIKLSDRALAWPWLEGFYYIPVLMLLLTSASKGG